MLLHDVIVAVRPIAKRAIKQNVFFITVVFKGYIILTVIEISQVSDRQEQARDIRLFHIWCPTSTRGTLSKGLSLWFLHHFLRGDNANLKKIQNIVTYIAEKN